MEPITIVVPLVLTPEGHEADIPAGVQGVRWWPNSDGETATVEIKGPPEVVAAALLESETHPLSLATKALLEPIAKQANMLADRAGHEDLIRDPGQIADDAKLALEKGQGGGDKDPGPGDTKTPPKEIGRG